MGIYAAFCTLPLEKSVSGVAFDIFKPNPNNSIEDRAYLRQMRTCFICELTNLSSKFQCCQYLVSIQMETVLNDTVASLLDAESLLLFPSCNVKQVLAVAGNVRGARDKVEEHLKACRSAKPVSCQSLDEGATFLKKQEGYQSTVGCYYESQSVWLHCNQLALLLCKDQENSTNAIIGQVLRDTCADLQDGELLEMVPDVSFERECLKRLVLMRTLVTELNRMQNYSLLRTITSSLLQNMYFMVEITLVHKKEAGEDKESRLKRGYAVSRQKAYFTFLGSLLTFVLREDTQVNSDQSKFLRRLITGSLTGNENIRDIIEEAHEMPYFEFNLRKKNYILTPSEEVHLLSMTSDLTATFLCRADDLCNHDIHRDSKGLIYAMITNASTRQPALKNVFIKIVSNSLLLTPMSIMGHSPRAYNELQTAINHHINYTEACRRDRSSIDSRPLISYRETILAPFLTEKIYFGSVDVRNISLLLLDEILTSFSSNNLRSEEKVYDAEGNLASFMTYAKVVRSLKTCLISDSVDTDEIKNCANKLLSLPVTTDNSKEMTTLQQHADSCLNTNQKLELIHINLFSKWLQDPDAPNLQLLTEKELELFPPAEKMKNPYHISDISDK